jgi:glycosyltransferase involved in cell wall biosynthesis
MNILHLVHRYWPSHGGAEKSFQLLSRSFAAAGHDVTVHTTNALDFRYFWDRAAAHLPPGEERIDGVRVVRHPVRYLPFHRSPSSWPARLPLAAAQGWLAHSPWLPSLIAASGRRHRSFDIVHASSLPVNAVIRAGCRFARRAGIPLIVSPHVHSGERCAPGGLLGLYTAPVQLEMLRHAAAVIAKTGGEAELLAAHGVARERITVVPNGLDLAEMGGGDGQRFRRRFGVEGPMVLHLAHKSVLKGSRDTVEAMKLLWRKGSEARLVLAGSTEQGFGAWLRGVDPRFREKIIDLESPDEQLKKDALAAQDIFVLPSKADSFGYVFLESWYYEKPVIGAMAGGIPAVIDDGHDGLLVPCGHPPVLAEYIDQLLRDAALRERLGRAGRQKLSRQFDWDKVVFPLYQELYDRLVR